mmetsp:Transcript_2604/g.7917  ORF Transcript_2604/g.7917 Transcript_2604/m.7917 type:complete len:244 (+) Transcript_2604:437-1168(+)
MLRCENGRARLGKSVQCLLDSLCDLGILLFVVLAALGRLVGVCFGLAVRPVRTELELLASPASSLQLVYRQPWPLFVFDSACIARFAGILCAGSLFLFGASGTKTPEPHPLRYHLVIAGEGGEVGHHQERIQECNRCHRGMAKGDDKRVSTVVRFSQQIAVDADYLLLGPRGTLAFAIAQDLKLLAMIRVAEPRSKHVLEPGASCFRLGVECCECRVGRVSHGHKLCFAALGKVFDCDATSLR